MTTVTNNLNTALLGDSSAASPSKNDAASADRFLKLLVTQMQNQDPLNPLDNAQVTSQLAQINTVNGIEKLNSTVQGLSGQFMQMQALQGASLVGRDVVIAGNQLSFSSGVGQGGFELGGPADSVSVEVLSPSGQVVDTLQLGAHSAGKHSFNWPAGTADASKGLSFRVRAVSGGVETSSTALMKAPVTSVSTSGNSLQLELAGGRTVAYADIKAFN